MKTMLESSGCRKLVLASEIKGVTSYNWRPFYEVQIGVEISVELYVSTHSMIPNP